MVLKFRFIIVAVSFLVVAGFSVHAQQKNALLIANARYSHFASLATPVAEARELKGSLESIGFTVTLLEDASREAMMDAILDFEEMLEKQGGIAFFHYGGHGIQVNGKNYLIPSNAEIPDERRVETRSVSVDEIMASLDAAATNANIVVLDACRNNPLPATSTRSTGRGLSVVAVRPRNSILVYSAEAGNIAQDGLFTPALCSAIRQEGKSFQDILMEVRKQVSEKTGGAQVPGEYNQSFEPIYLAGLPAQQTPGNAEEAASPSRPPVAAVSPVKTHQSPAMASIDGGTFYIGRARHHKVTLSPYYIGVTEVTQAEYESVIGSNPSAFQDPSRPVECVSWYDAIRYCNALSEREGLTPAYTLSAFDDPEFREMKKNMPIKALEKLGDTLHSKIYDGQYTVRCDWSANGYRLPTEAEWEYAAKGGLTGESLTYAGSDDPFEAGWYEKNSLDSTQPVRTKKANVWGLYDMSGNVEEWCWDFESDYTREDKVDPRGPFKGSNHIIRGGSWDEGKKAMYPWNREDDDGVNANSERGFRVARSRVGAEEKSE
ncbi:MAG: SUMF1/EgtB/PvdO family nonheme iron enzyme [Spirochaetales bacterium]|nr:SUMF1/EgtB/PvdO family nonheme iron enzyme [Spirochaetales bacterium]